MICTLFAYAFLKIDVSYLKTSREFFAGVTPFFWLMMPIMKTVVFFGGGGFHPYMVCFFCDLFQLFFVNPNPEIMI